MHRVPLYEKKVTNPEEFLSTNDAETKLESIPFDRQDIIDKIDSLSAGAAAGPDGIPAILLKKCKHSLADGLLIMFRTFLLDGKVPGLLKQAFVIPVHKSHYPPTLSRHLRG